ncbi:iron(III) transport system substrate-binding protein [Rhizobium rhizoryzae]|uniref:Iron(III) transport system substrate-binding protein n=2 Tax=Rhizobium/Agrobacterium group TaxID=227290 RepID=A0A7W6PSR4_9HYPH|nr:iron(III) transport system substrate-binding protein [Rhizobium rhizoryzae]
MFRLGAIALGLVTTLAFGSQARSEPLNILCGVDEAWCVTMKRAFERHSGLTVSMQRKSTGEILDQIRLEKNNPSVDVWWGGTGDTHLQAASENLLEAYTSKHETDVLPWAQNFFDMSGGRAAGIYAGALGFAYNSELLKKANLAAPNCWKDLISEAYRGKIQSGNPNSSGTAFTTLATLIQLFGEDEAFTYMKALDRNIADYTKAGSAPVKAAARGETLIGISFMHDAVTQKEAGAPLVIVAPCEGTGYEIGAVSIVLGTKNRDLARRFVDFALSPEGQATGAQADQNQVPSNSKASLPPGAPDISLIKMVDYDFATFGSPEERSRLLARFDTEIHPPTQ